MSSGTVSGSGPAVKEFYLVNRNHLSNGSKGVNLPWIPQVKPTILTEFTFEKSLDNGLRAKPRKSKKSDLISDYGVWFVNYR